MKYDLVRFPVGGFPRYEVDIQGPRQHRAIQAKMFTRKPLYAVTFDRTPDLAADGNSQARQIPSTRGHHGDEQL
jgi:hypothetical protein